MRPPPPPILEAFAQRYERSAGGRTGETQREFRVDIEDLLLDLRATEGDARAVAEQHLRDAATHGLIHLEPLHPRDPHSLHRVRLPLGGESALYQRLGRPSPSHSRSTLANQFTEAAHAHVPERWQVQWSQWCNRMAEESLAGRSVTPFDRTQPFRNQELLDLLPRLLSWEGESLVRFASCVLCGHSKRLGDLAAVERTAEGEEQLRGKLGRLLSDITTGQIHSLEDLGIVPNPRSVLVHGPLRLRFGAQWLDLGLLLGPFKLSHRDVLRADELTVGARRCVTIENETSFHELAKLNSGELLIQTSFPGSATAALIQRCPADIEYWHFGDSDEAGFEILRVLREKTGRNFKPFLMERGRDPHEQESLGRPEMAEWPFYCRAVESGRFGPDR